MGIESDIFENVMDDLHHTEIKDDRCEDFDEDCEDIADKGVAALLHCWKYDPIRGVCPYLTDKKNK